MHKCMCLQLLAYFAHSSQMLLSAQEAEEGVNYNHVNYNYVKIK